ncbi:MAG: ABC transporter ATP-binding protein [Myxococcota bacterium]
MNDPSRDDPIVRVRGVTKAYGEGDARVQVLNGIDFEVRGSEVVALCGPSGSGKSTLLNLIGCLDRPTSGSVHLAGVDVSTLDRAAQARMRLHTLGFVFQSFHLLSESTAVENVMMPLQYAGVPKGKRKERAERMLMRVGLEDRMDHRPHELSGGQKQRVAIARACVMNPRLLLADEPTGALDTRTGAAVLDLMSDLHEREGMAVVVVTHDEEVARWAKRRVDLRDGLIVSMAHREARS